MRRSDKNMFHTESYIDHESVDSNLHMVSLAGKMQGKDTLVWAVWKDREQVAACQVRLREWFLNELGTALDKNEAEVLKELTRISSGLQCRLYLYDGQKLYRAGEHVEEGTFYMGPSIGAGFHKEGTAASLPLEKKLEQMKSELAKVSSCVSEKDPNRLKALGNVWQQNIMDCIVEDSLSYAYFMLWEAR